jgi:UDP-N-acetylmuramate dehydrogenase
LISLSALHTFGFNTFAKSVKRVDSLSTLYALAQQNIPNVILGEGSNTVFTEDYYGVIWQNCLSGITITEDSDFHYITAASGENWHQLVSKCVSLSIGGFENLALIPGTVGAAPIQNIGAYGVEISSFISEVEYFDFQDKTLKTINAYNCQFGYRDSIFKHELRDVAFITKVMFSLPKRYEFVTHYGELSELENPSIDSIYEAVIRVRKNKLPDPHQVGNAGSFFKNPVVPLEVFESIQIQFPDIPHYPISDKYIKIPAAWLIDTLGFKGTIEDGIQCHPQQALVLTNYNNGTGRSLLNFANIIKSAVKAQFGIVLEHEVQLLGQTERIVL